MEDHQYTLYLVLALVSLLVVLDKRRRRSAKSHEHEARLPPGPWKLPVIGTLHHLAGQLPHRAMRDLARRHGDVMLLRNGEVETVVVSSREAARAVMKTHDAAFASRPLSATVAAITCGGRDIIFAPYGEHWRQLRKIAITELLSARRVLSFRPVREQEVSAMLKACAAAAARSEPVEMRERLAALVADATARAVLGDRCKDRDVFLRELDRSIQLVAGFNPADLWPSSWLVRRLSSSVRRAEECRDTVHGILDGIIKEHLERMDSGAGAGEAEDLLDVLLKIQRDGGLQIPLDMVVIKAVIFDIFGAGSETSSTTLEWAISELIRNPKAMRRATAEVRQAFAGHGTVPEHALGKLHYLHLVIRETFRLHVPLPLLLPRESQEPCRVLGYDVPRGTTTLVNVWALGRDERYWPGGDPDKFRPERFEAGSAADFKGVDFELLPFGAGRRMCPGMAFGLANVELALASLLFHFDWEAPGLSDPTKFDMTEAFGITARRKANLLLRPILRVPLPDV
ncbi:hypothetical protein PR202_gb27994 [Eleusine coracana subsp. coracana]|uniref:Uncharacterized protein n=1 Tax=Eleusine coracana subsp. coracana TaxID=191504 RepID=A0AAV5FVN0_ELECO|nr:hypothetical protein PR202_gb27994 [Eleusine coracana subsp. coracana]